MSFTDQSSPVVALLTNTARNYFSRAHRGELSFKVVGFSIGRGGYNVANPVETIPIDQDALTLIDQVHPDTTGYAAIQSIEEINPTTRVYNCRLPATLANTNADYGIGELGLWARVEYSQNNSIPVGTEFLYAVAHMPIRAKTHKDVFLFRVVVNY